MLVVGWIRPQCWHTKAEHLAGCKHHFKHTNSVPISPLLWCKGRKQLSPSFSHLMSPSQKFSTKSNVRQQTRLQPTYFQHWPDIWPNTTVGLHRTAECQPLAWPFFLCVSYVISWLAQNRSTHHCSVPHCNSPQIVDTADWCSRQSKKLINSITTTDGQQWNVHC